MSSLLSVDVGYYFDQGIRAIVGGILDVPKMATAMISALNSSPPDYFKGGQEFGRIWKLIFDVNVAN